MWRVLSVDDKREVAENVRDALQEWGNRDLGLIKVEIETNFAAALERLKHENFDLVVLDLHGANDPDPLTHNADLREQEGERVLNSLRAARFVPVIFYTGFAEKIANLQTAIVRVVKKGQNDVESLRRAVSEIMETGIPVLLQRIEDEKRSYMWDTVDKNWDQISAHGSTENLAYLLARRLSARLSGEAVKGALGHDFLRARPIEMYIYPAIAGETIKTGCVVTDGKEFWIVGTPACDFAQEKVDHVLLIGAMPLDDHEKFKKWQESGSWMGEGDSTNKQRSDYASLKGLLENKNDRYWYLPESFFIGNLVVDFQRLKQLPVANFQALNTVCRLDTPFREELLLQLSRYYGRMGIPPLEMSGIFKSLLKKEVAPAAEQ